MGNALKFRQESNTTLGTALMLGKLNAVNRFNGVDDLFVVTLARSVDGNVADQKILADAGNIDRFNVAAGTPDGSRDLAEFARTVMNLDSQS